LTEALGVAGDQRKHKRKPDHDPTHEPDRSRGAGQRIWPADLLFSKTCYINGDMTRQFASLSYLHWLLPAILIVTPVFCGQARASGELDPTNAIQTAAAVRSLTSDQAALHFFDRNIFIQFIQDETAGIYLPTNNLPPLSAGQLVEIEGVTSPGEFAPVVIAQRVTVLGTQSLPPAKPVSFEELISGGEDSQLVEIQGIVRSIGVDPKRSSPAFRRS
jgi:hypothetical protein